MVKFLYRPNRTKVAVHLWDDGDTYCRMWSTGGLSPEKYSLHDKPPENRKICTECARRWCIEKGFFCTRKWTRLPDL